MNTVVLRDSLERQPLHHAHDADRRSFKNRIRLVFMDPELMEYYEKTSQKHETDKANKEAKRDQRGGRTDPRRSATGKNENKIKSEDLCR